MSLTTVEIQSFSGPSVVDMEGSGEPTIIYINQGPAGDISAAPISTITNTNLVGYIYGNGSKIAGATPGSLLAEPSKIAIRLQNGGLACTQINFGEVGGISSVLQVGGLTGNRIYTLPNATGYVALTKNANGANDDTEIYVKAAQPITAGQAVYISDALGAVKIISLAQANTDALSSKTIGLCAQSLSANGFGYVVTEGDLSGLSINLGSGHTVTEGDPIWLSPTTPGGLLFGTANKPSAPNHLVFLGIVTRINGNTLTDIYVKVQNGFELEELHNVAINGQQNGQVLTYESSTQLWKNKANYTAKSTTGNPATGIEGEICINTFDNNVKIYADGGWRQIATW